MPGGNDIAIRTRGIFDERLFDGYRRFDGNGLNLLEMSSHGECQGK